jgi:hypothetical protein
MSHVNGDDIDDIFRRASERYPLRTDSADWNKLAADLERDPSLILPAVNADEGGRRKKRFFWLFLLLPLGGLGYYAVKVTAHGNVRQPAIVQSVPAAHAPTEAPAPSSSTAINQNHDNPSSGGTTTSSGRETAKSDGSALSGGKTAKSDGAAAHPDGSTPSGGTTANRGTTASAVGNPTSPASDPFQPSAHTPQRPNTHLGSAKFSARETPGQNSSLRQPGLHSPKATPASGDPDGLQVSAGESSTSSNSGSSSSANPDPRSYHPFGLQRARTTGGIDLTVNVQSRHTAAATPAPIKLPKPARQASFYVGLLGAPDLSTVKMQSVKSVGTTFGLLLGYNINPKWAIESGLYLDRKKYYTEGEYFSRKNINVGPNVNISNVDGTCNMWEIPLNIRYNFGQGEKMKWFATAGLSTYLMTKEHYSYVFQNATGSWPYSKQYNTHSNYLFSVFDLSIGYEQKIGKIGNLRLEPYLRVPLSGIGTGSLPIMSAGLNIGITRRIW